MFKHNINLAFRLIFRNKVFSTINIAGLAFGLACSILLFLWVKDEFSYDKFNKNINEIYIFQHWQHYGDENFPCPVAPGAAAPALKKEYPQIVNAARMDRLPSVLVSKGDKFFVENINAVDPDLFQILTFNAIQGTLDSALSTPNSIILTKRIASKFFGDENPIGKDLVLDNRLSFKVSAVVEDMPNNSSHNFGIIMPFEALKNFGKDINNWGSNWARTIVMLQKGVNYEDFEKTLQGFLTKHRGETASKVEEFLYPLSRLHLYNIMGGGQIVIVKIFIIIAILILLIACINYTNLSSARAAARAKEIGMRKVSGADKWKLIKQFIGESLFFSFIALNFSLIIVRLLLPAFNNMSGKMIKLNYIDPQLIVTLILVWVLTGVVAGLYPAFILSSFSPIKAVKSDSKVGSKKSIFRIALVLVQFTVAIGLIITTIVVFKQLTFLKDKDLGFNKENILYVPVRGKIQEKYSLIKKEIQKNPKVIGITITSHNQPTAVWSNGGGWSWEGKDPSVNPLVSNLSVDDGFVKTFGLKLSDGRFFSDSIAADTSGSESAGYNVVINKYFAKMIGEKDITQKVLKAWGMTFPIIGVIEDYNFKPANYPIEPMVFFYDFRRSTYLFIKVSGDKVTDTMNKLKEVFETYNPGLPFDYGFLDDDYDTLYRAENRLVSIFKAFAFLAIIISCLGLFGLASFTAQQRTKEIGIRKALGGSVFGIVTMLAKEFTKWVVIANIIAWPITYYLMNKWLQEYPYRIELSIWIFIISGMIAFIVALLTVFFQAYTTARRNPVVSLRYE
ncbi:MAG: ABC transporter permease [Tenuifilaceae bacterium]